MPWASGSLPTDAGSSATPVSRSSASTTATSRCRTPSGDVRLVVNGEFYGYRAIREQLRAEGCVFQTESDSEIALHLYLREGMNLGRPPARRVRGADRGSAQRRCMFAFRDRFGIKPLFYAVHEGDVFFASEVKALLALGVPARWNREAVFQECFHFRPHSRTLFAGVYTVPPGHYAIAQDGEVSVYPYWDLKFPTQAELGADDRSDAEVVQGFRAVLDDAVRERLIADVEVASYLSGGIDSCAVLGLAQRHMDRPIRAFTLAFEDPLYDEIRAGPRAGRALGRELPPDSGQPARAGGRLLRRRLACGDALHQRPRRREIPAEPGGSGRRHQGRLHRRGVGRDAGRLRALPPGRPALQQRAAGSRDRPEAARGAGRHQSGRSRLAGDAGRSHRGARHRAATAGLDPLLDAGQLGPRHADHGILPPGDGAPASPA